MYKEYVLILQVKKMDVTKNVQWECLGKLLARTHEGAFVPVPFWVLARSAGSLQNQATKLDNNQREHLRGLCSTFAFPAHYMGVCARTCVCVCTNTRMHAHGNGVPCRMCKPGPDQAGTMTSPLSEQHKGRCVDGRWLTSLINQKIHRESPSSWFLINFNVFFCCLNLPVASWG